MTRLYWRLLIWFCLANVVTLVVSVLVTRHLTRELLQREPDWSTIAQQSVTLAGQHDPHALLAWHAQLRRQHTEISLIAPDGTPRLPLPPPLRRHLAALTGSPAVVLHPRPGLTLAGLTVTADDGQTWHFVAAHFAGPPAHGHLWLAFAIEILVSLLVIGAVGWWVARSISRPVSAVQSAARRVANGDLRARVDAPMTQARDELGQLARDFDLMASRIETLVERQRSVLQDVSHEFRSPLARLSVALELARHDAGTELPSLARADREIARLDRLIGEVLELSRMEDQLPGLARSRLDLAALARARAAEAQPEIAARGLQLHLQLAEGVAVDGSEVLLGRALDNLLSNAIKFSPRDAPLWLRLRKDGAHALIEVADSGPGVPAAELAALFRPFFRGSNAPRAEGQGLGLAIVARVVAAHGGDCLAENRPEGGLRVTLRLPGSLSDLTDRSDKHAS